MSAIDDADISVRFRVGVFSLLGLLLMGAITVFVNDKPFWWRPCQLVHINVEDATGLKSKSPVRSLGLQIGYLRSVELFESHVRLGICITAPVEVLPDTRAYIRGEGFLGDKFVELKPVRYIGDDKVKEVSLPKELLDRAVAQALDFIAPAAYAQNQREGREIPVGQTSKDVQKLVDEVDGLVNELSGLTKNMKQALDPKELQSTMEKLNMTLENASATFSPEGNLTTTAQRALAKLEDAIEQMRDQITRINQGDGSVGRLLNDPTYAEELEKALKNLNHLLGKTADFRFVVDLGAEYINGYTDAQGRGYFNLAIWPAKTRYYLLGIAADPRGLITSVRTTTTTGGTSTSVVTTTQDQTGFVFTGALGVLWWKRLELAAGFFYGDGGVRIGFHVGPGGYEDRIRIVSEGYYRNNGVGTESQLNGRAYLMAFPTGSPYFSAFYIRGGLDSFREVNGELGWSAGAGVSFDDEDIKLLFTFI